MVKGVEVSSRDAQWYRGQPLYAYSYRHAHPPTPLLVTPIQPKPLRTRQRPYPRREAHQRRGRSQSTAGTRSQSAVAGTRSQSTGMGALLTRGMKQVKSDGNGNQLEEVEREDRSVPFSLPLPPQLDLLLDAPRVSRAVQVDHAWNPEDRSLNIFVKDDDEFTFHR